MSIAIYARVSTRDKQNIENQITVLDQWATEFDGEKARYIDHASGSRSDREAFQRLLSDAREGKVKVLLIWALDRLSREGIAELCGHLKVLKESGVRVLSRQEPWLDTDGPVSELLIAIFAWVAKQERLRLKDRIHAGLATARSRGKRLGRPFQVKDPDRVIELRSQGRPLREIASLTGNSKSALSRMLCVKSKETACIRSS